MDKRYVWNSFITVVLLVALAGCAEVNVLPPLNKNMNPEDSAIFIIPGGADVKRINGAKRGLFSSWVGGGAGYGPKAATLLMPAGENTIIFKYTRVIEGWGAGNLTCETAMDAGKMYILSIARVDTKKGSTLPPVINVATSFIRNNIVGLIPFSDLVPSPNPKGLVYQINEIDQAAFDRFLLEEGSYRKTIVAAFLFGRVIGLLWLLIATVILPFLYFAIFMENFIHNHKAAAKFLAIVLIGAGIIIIHLNSSGILSLSLVSTIIVGVGFSGLKSSGLAGIKDDRNGLKEFANKNYAGAVLEFSKAIKVNSNNATYFTHRGNSYAWLQEWTKAASDFSEAVRLDPDNETYKKNLSTAQAQVAKVEAGTSI
jgi:hypothetical protein